MSVSQSTSAVIKCADKATNKPKASESITDFCVWHEDWSLLHNWEITLREMGGRFAHGRVMNCVFAALLCFVSETIARSIGLVCVFWYSLVCSKANGAENLVGLVKFLIKIWEALSLSSFLYTDLLRDQTSTTRINLSCFIVLHFLPLKHSHYIL